MSESQSTAASPAIVQSISNARLQFIVAGLWLSIFLSAMDTTIITTSLIKISSGFDALNQAAWLITAYLLTYNSFLMIVAKISDVVGVKISLIGCNTIFLVFSMACGGARSMNQLIAFRAIQGIGGSGLYSLVFVAIMKLITPQKMGFYSGVISSVFAIANLLGPILGGVISDHTTWRWIFWLNGPIIVTAIVLLFFSMPGLADGRSAQERLRGFDIIGGILSVGWPIPLLFALQEGGSQYPWNSATIIGTLVVGIVGLVLFAIYEAWRTTKTKKESIFPISFVADPVPGFLLLSMLLMGMPFYVAVIQLPQRFQAVNGTSAERAGILLLPLTLLTPLGAMITGIVMGKKIKAEYMLIIASVVVSVGIGLLSSLSIEAPFSKVTYGYEIITGLGLGLMSTPYYFLLYTSVPEKDIAVGTGAVNMVRTLGGALAIAICSALHHSTLRSKLPAFLGAEQITAIEKSIDTIASLPLDTQHQIRQVFGKSYKRQFRVILALACLNFLVTIALALVRKNRGILGAMPERNEENEFMKAPETSSEAKTAKNDKAKGAGGALVDKGFKADVANKETEQGTTNQPDVEEKAQVS